MKHSFFLFYFVDFVAVRKGLVCCSRGPHTLDKDCRFTVAESGQWITRMAPGDTSKILEIISRKFQNNAIHDIEQI